MKRSCRLALAIVAACFAVTLMTASHAAGAIIRLKPTATVNSSVVLLADVADVFDSSPQVVEALQRATLMPAPAAGSATEVEFSTIRARLSSLGFSLANLEMTGSSRVNIQKQAEQSTPREPRATQQTDIRASPWRIRRAKQILSKAIANYLQTAELGDVEVELKLDSLWVPHVIAAQRRGFEIRGGKPPWDAWQTLAIRLLDREEQIQSFHIQCRVITKPLVPVAKYALPVGHVIARTDIDYKRLGDASGPPPTIDDLVGRETTRAIRPGQPIHETLIRQIPLIRRGDVVTAIARIGGIRVKRQLYARSAGAMGERVMLSTLDRREQIEATVSGYHQAVVLNRSPSLPQQVGTDLVRGQSQRSRFSVNSSQSRGVSTRSEVRASDQYRSAGESARQLGGRK